MNITDKEKRTVDYYNQEAESWTSAHGGNESESYWKEEMEKFHQLLPSGKVLEIGSGAGKDAAALIALGYDYTGTDASEGLINVAQRRNSQARFKKVGVYELDFPAHEFDGFWTTATLLHIPKDRIDEALRKVKLQVKPNGIGFISMKQGEGEKTDEKTGRWFAYYSQQEFTDVLERNDYAIVDSATRQGEKDVWLCFWVKA